MKSLSLQLSPHNLFSRGKILVTFLPKPCKHGGITLLQSPSFLVVIYGDNRGGGETPPSFFHSTGNPDVKGEILRLSRPLVLGYPLTTLEERQN